MSILQRLKTQQVFYQAHPDLAGEAALVDEYDAACRARQAALARNDIESVLFWGDQANGIARQMARSSLVGSLSSMS